MNEVELDSTLDHQIEYYRQRAPEYDEWFFRQGRYDRGPRLNGMWFAEIEQVRSALVASQPSGRILDLACGTGIWTELLHPFASELTAIDLAPEMLEQCRERMGSLPVSYVQADIYQWTPDREFDFIFFGFWLSHIPSTRFQLFWSKVDEWLTATGRVFLIDSLYEPTSTAGNHRLAAPDATTTKRRLNDGREFEIIKVFYRPAELSSRLRSLGWEVVVRGTATYFLYGGGRRAT